MEEDRMFDFDCNRDIGCCADKEYAADDTRFDDLLANMGSKDD